MEFLKSRKQQILNMVLALFFSAGAFGFFGLEYSERAVLYFATAFALYQLITRTRTITNRRVVCSSLLFSLALTAAFTAGRQSGTKDFPYFTDLTILDWAYILPYWGFVSVFVLNLVDWLLKNEMLLDPPKTEVAEKQWHRLHLILIAFWIPYFLIFYPGNLSLDSMDSVQQIMGLYPYANNHPIVFTLFIGTMMKLGMMIGDINFGIACFSFVQMVIFSGMLSYTVYWMEKKGVPSWIRLITFGYYALNPLIASYSVTMWKDVIFSGCMLLLVLFFYDVVDTHGGFLGSFRNVCKLALLCLVMAFWRNSIGFFLMVGIVILTAFYRKYAKRVIPVFLALLCLIMVVQGPVYEYAGIKKGNFAESVSIPLQQISYTLTQNGVLDPESREILENIMPLDQYARVYDPYGVDAVKFQPEFDNAYLNAHKSEFLRTWLRLMPDNMGSYLKAWLMITKGYYHIGTTATPIWYGIIPVEAADVLGIYRTDILYSVMKLDFASLVEAFLFYIYDLPVFSTIYSIAAMVWSVLLCVLVLIRRGVRRYVTALVPLLGLWVTMMAAAPVNCEFRYMFSFHLALPVVFMLLLCVPAQNRGGENG